MRIVLIEIKCHGYLFLAEPPAAEAAGMSSVESNGVRGWFARKTAALFKEMEQARGWVARTLNRIWTRLQRFIAPDEYLLRGLRAADSLTLEYPAAFSQEQVIADWNGYLRRRWVKHRNWMIVDAVLFFPSILLTPLPGPNVICYWFLYRCIIHFLACRGMARAKKGVIPTTLQAREELDAPVAPDDEEQIARLSEALQFADLGTVLSSMAPQAIEPDPDLPS